MVGTDGPRARARVAELAKTDCVAALEVARAIVDPWYRCQSLVAIAENVGDPKKRSRILQWAFEAADETAVPNRIATAGSRPLALLARSADEGRVLSELQRLLAVIRSEPHPIRRMDGQAALFDAVSACPARIADIALGALMDTIRHAHGWRRDRMACFVAAHLLERGEAARAWAIVDTCELPREKRRARRYLEARFGPRPLD